MNSKLSSQGETSWFSVCGEVDPALERALAGKVESLRVAGKFSEKDQAHIQSLSFSVTRDGFVATPERVEYLRRLCQIYSADVRPQAPTSHRKVIGPVIVLVKRILHPLVNALVGPAFRNQREFNAITVSLLTDLCNETRVDRR